MHDIKVGDTVWFKPSETEKIAVWGRGPHLVKDVNVDPWDGEVFVSIDFYDGGGFYRNRFTTTAPCIFDK